MSIYTVNMHVWVCDSALEMTDIFYLVTSRDVDFVCRSTSWKPDVVYPVEGQMSFKVSKHQASLPLTSQTLLKLRRHHVESIHVGLWCASLYNVSDSFSPLRREDRSHHKSLFATWS